MKIKPFMKYNNEKKVPVSAYLSQTQRKANPTIQNVIEQTRKKW